jgi:hypothetical protein
LDTFTLRNQAPIAPWLGIPILILLGVWIGGLLSAAVWRIRRRAGSLAAHLSIVLIGFAVVFTATYLLNYAGLHDGGDEGWLYEWFGWFCISVIDAMIFWSVLIVGIQVGLSLLSALIVGIFAAHWCCSFGSDILLFCAWIIGLPVWCIAAMSKEVLKIDLPKKHYDQLCCGESVDS